MVDGNKNTERNIYDLLHLSQRQWTHRLDPLDLPSAHLHVEDRNFSVQLCVRTSRQRFPEFPKLFKLLSNTSLWPLFCISGCIRHLEPWLILLKSMTAVWLQSDKSHFISSRSFKPTCYIDCQQQPKLAVSHTVDLYFHCCHGSFNAQINTSNQSLTASGRQTDGWLLRLRPTWKNMRHLTETILELM